MRNFTWAKPMRALADVSAAVAAQHIGTSYSTIWNFENGFAELTLKQESKLRIFYAQKIQERLAKILELLPELREESR